MAKQPSTTIRDLKGRFASRRKRKVLVYVGSQKAGPRYSREVIKRWRAHETGPVVAPEPTLRERVEAWSGAKARARKKKIPPAVEFVEKFHKVAQVKFTGDETLGEMLARSKMLELVAGYRPGQKLRIRIEGTTADAEKIRRENVFVLRGNASKRMNLLLYQTIAVLGKEFIAERGRGYRILTENDELTFILEVVSE